MERGNVPIHVMKDQIRRGIKGDRARFRQSNRQPGRGDIGDRKFEDGNREARTQPMEAPRIAGTTTEYIVIWRAEEMIRVYRVQPGENLDTVHMWDRQMSDGSYLEGDTEIEAVSHEATTLEKVKSWIECQWSERGGASTERLVAYPRKPCMGRARNQTAYAVLHVGAELWVITEQNAYLQRPGIWKSGEGQPWST